MSEAVQPQVVRVWPMYRAMVGVGLLCGLLIVGVYQLTGPVIARNRAEALERAILQVLPAAKSSRTFHLADDERFVPLEAGVEGAEVVHAGYDAEGRLVGLALEGRGMGYQDVIAVIFGYAFADDAVIGIRVLESRETPGLGDRIETDADFLANFERLDVRLDAAGSALANPIEAVKQGEKQHPWQIDGITGATISSVAIAKILQASSSAWIPRVRERLDDFRGAAGSAGSPSASDERARRSG
ncbi:MAG: FMN-binding protein [Myxococcota bacterium]|nr:FMN-binding protein [Myxococcota bacterium]